MERNGSFRSDGQINKDERWVGVQTRTFTRWCNSHLSDRLIKIEDLSADLQSGFTLCQLLEIISDKSVKHAKTARMKLQAMENLNAGLDFIKREGLKLVNIGAEDIYAGNTKIILGLIWTLILRYQINKGIAEGSPKWLLLEWVKNQVRPYGVVEPRDFKTSWIDGSVMSALADSLEPGTNPKPTWTGDPIPDVNQAMQRSLEAYEIPRLMDAEDMVESPDELALMTYVAQFRDWADKQAARNAYLRGIPNAGFSYIEGDGLHTGHADVPAHFTIFARNYQDTALTTGGHHWKTSVTGPAGAVLVQLVDNNNGTYSASYTPTEAGQYTVSVQLSPKPDIDHNNLPEGIEFKDVRNSPAHPVIKQSVSGGHSTAEGPGLQSPYTDVPTHFTITARDKHGNPVPEGGSNFAVAISGPSGNLAPHAVDNGNGTYRVDYTPTEKGPHTINVTKDGVHIQSSPFHVGVKPSVDPARSTAAGPGVNSGENINTKPTHFTITARDKHGEPVGEGNHNVGVQIQGPKGPVAAPIKDNGDGTYDVSYLPADAGNHNIVASINNQPIHGFPATVLIKPCVVTSNCTASGPGVEGGKALKVDKRAPFRITARNEAGEQVADGGFHFDVQVQGPNGSVAPEALSDNGDGTYDSAWTPVHSGDHVVSITSEGNHIQGSPFHLKSFPQPSSGNSFVEGAGLTDGFDNEPAHFVIHLNDKNNAPVSDGHPQVSINGPSPVAPHVTNNGDGTYSVEYSADEAGSYQITVLTTDDGEGQNVKGSPSTAVIIPGADADATPLGEFSLKIHAVDKHGQPKTVGGDRFEVAIAHRAEKGGAESDHDCRGQDNGDGTYTATYTLVGTGRFTVSIKLNGRHIKNSPFHHNLK
ncbi:MAG: filamin/ABP280 repeat domain-containing protein [archaeon]|nr:filamin/ABP280 repeat domain-containing protein [archaeon]